MQQETAPLRLHNEKALVSRTEVSGTEERGFKPEWKSHWQREHTRKVCYFSPNILTRLLIQLRRRQQASQQPETKQGGLPTSMLQKVVSTNNDAMNILFEAALIEEAQSVMHDRSAPESALCIPRSLNETDALRIWNACRFVKMGWFSSHEAIALVDLLVYRHF